MLEIKQLFPFLNNFNIFNINQSFLTWKMGSTHTNIPSSYFDSQCSEALNLFFIDILVLRQFLDHSFIAENIRKMAGALPWVSRWALRSSSSLNLPVLSTPGKPVKIIHYNWCREIKFSSGWINDQCMRARSVWANSKILWQTVKLKREYWIIS